MGDGASFVEEVREKFGKVLGMTKETQKKRTHENMTLDVGLRSLGTPLPGLLPTPPRSGLLTPDRARAL